MPSEFEKSIISAVKNSVLNQKDTVLECTDKLCSFARAQQVSYIVYSGCVAVGLDKSTPAMKRLFIAANGELLQHERQVNELALLYKAFDEQSVDYMRLKGARLKGLYPCPEMRVMSDADILIRQEQYPKVRSIMKGLGFEFVTESEHEYIWKKGNALVLELHKQLIPSYNEDYYAYFGDGWKRAVAIGKSEYTLSPEDTFIYVFTHFAKHYRDGGIGIKHVTDIYLYLKNTDMDALYVNAELKKLKLYTFYQNVVSLCNAWFDGSEFNEITEHITKVILSGGAYGTHKAKVHAAALRATLEGKNVFLKKAFPSLHVMRLRYKYLEKAPILLPFAWCSRIVTALLCKRDKVLAQAEDIKSVTDKDIADYQAALRFVGLDFNIRESGR
ncbi:MAG: nucleotidyltransferase family protein [Clostridia bacterium]|nr:nucleotidyltransferase family protein [Clostridia bacterium]